MITIYQLFRSSHNRMLGGVCGGIARHLNIEPWIVRLAFIILIFSGLSLAIYPIAWFVIPLDTRVPDKSHMVLGVCSEFAYRLDIDVSLVRICTIILGLASLGIATVVYIGVWLFLKAGNNRTLNT